MNEVNDIHQTARDWYQAKLAKGQGPRRVKGGELDGLPYFVVDIEGRVYWLTDVGLFDPPEGEAG